MSTITKSFKSSQNISHEATQQKKDTKIAAGYTEVEQFRASDHNNGYFCYNCVYFVKPQRCAIGTGEGMDVMGRSSAIIAPHG
jgi:exopolysaccharide biosynthesis protein